MTINLTFDAETLGLIADARVSYNAAAGTNLTDTEYIAREISASWEFKRVAAIQASGAALTAAVISLPKADRDACIAFIQAKLAP